jgi:death-on-curing protein
VIYLTFQDLLSIAEQLPGDPLAEDYGVLVAAVARHQAVVFDTEVYGSLRLKAAALVESLARADAFESGNLRFAWDVAVAFLGINAVRVSAPVDDVLTLMDDVRNYRAGVKIISTRLTAWTR